MNRKTKKRINKLTNLFHPRTTQLYFMDECLKLIRKATTSEELEKIISDFPNIALDSVNAVVPVEFIEIERPRCLDYCRTQIPYLTELVESKKQALSTK